MQTTMRHNLGFFSLLLCFCAFWLVAIIYLLWQGSGVRADMYALAHQRLSWLPGPFSDTSPIFLIAGFIPWYSSFVIMLCAGFGRRYPKQLPPGSIPRPRWTHDLPLVLVMLAWIGFAWAALNSPPPSGGSTQQFVFGLLWLSLLMLLAHATCAWIIARYGPSPVVRQAARK